MAQKTLGLTSRVKLANGMSIPQIHLGLYMTSGSETQQIVQWGLEAGYRGFDSAQMYGNEKAAGAGIMAFLQSKTNTADLKREDIHYTSKLSSNSSYTSARQSISRSVQKCGLGYIDLFLLHSPYGGKKARLESWRAVEDAIEAGEVKIGGISNFGARHIQELLEAKPRIVPQVNQIEVHPFNMRENIVKACRDAGMVVQAYAPLARSYKMKDPTIIELSKKYGCTPGQLMVRWSCQHGYVPLPKSSKKERIVENGQVGGFEIGEEDMKRMDGLNEYLVTDWDPYECP